LPSEDETTSTTRSITTETIPELGIDLSLNTILLVIFILLLIIILALVSRRSKTKPVAPPKVQSKTPDTLPEEIKQREFCSNCGEPILDDSKFCMKCGTPKE
jgi:uncharacterized paraquat-inducible protein A